MHGHLSSKQWQYLPTSAERRRMHACMHEAVAAHLRPLAAVLMAPALALQSVRVQPVQVQPAKLNPPAGLHNDPDHDQPALSGPPTNRWRGQLTRVSASVRLVAPLVGPISAVIPGCPLRHESDLPEVLLSTPYQRPDAVDTAAINSLHIRQSPTRTKSSFPRKSSRVTAAKRYGLNEGPSSTLACAPLVQLDRPPCLQPTPVNGR